MSNDRPRLRQVGGGRGARDRGAHAVLVVLDDVDHRQLPELRHVEALVDLALVGGAVAEIGQRDVVVAAISVGEGKPGAERDLGADDAVAAEEALLHREHVHRAALALGIAAAAAGQLRHDALGVHAAGQHVAVIAIAGDDLVARLDRHLHADHHRLLADIEVAEAADQPHAVQLAGLLLEAADQQHVAVGRKLLVLVEFRHRSGSVRRLARGCAAGRLGRLFVAGDGHFSPRMLLPEHDLFRKPVPTFRDHASSSAGTR